MNKELITTEEKMTLAYNLIFEVKEDIGQTDPDLAEGIQEILDQLDILNDAISDM